MTSTIRSVAQSAYNRAHENWDSSLSRIVAKIAKSVMNAVDNFTKPEEKETHQKNVLGGKLNAMKWTWKEVE